MSSCTFDLPAATTAVWSRLLSLSTSFCFLCPWVFSWHVDFGGQGQTPGKDSNPSSVVCPYPLHDPRLSLFTSAAVALKDVLLYSFLKPWLGEYLQMRDKGILGGQGKVLTLA